MREWSPPVEVNKELPHREVKRSQVIQQGGRHICLQECVAPVETPKLEPKTITTTEIYDLSGGDENYVASVMIHISATVYMEGEKHYSHIRLSQGEDKIEVWSSMNAMEIAGMSNYMARGIEYYTLLGHGMEREISASEAGCPVHRDKLNKDKARFLVVGDRDDESQALEAMRGLHAIYNKEKVALEVAYQRRLSNQERARIWDAENPPKPKDITIRFWKRDPNPEAK